MNDSSLKKTKPAGMKLSAIGFLSLLLVQAASANTNNQQECESSHYPTAVIADYVLACMAANGNSFKSLHQCSCSIDFIRQRLSFEEYERAQTIMQVRLDRGQRGTFFKDTHWARTRVEPLERLQAESTLRCF